jgi:hypothetical protein
MAVEKFIQDILTATSGEWMDFTDTVEDVLLTLVIPASGSVTLQISEESARTKSKIDDVETFAAGTHHRMVPRGPRFVRVKNTGPNTVNVRWGLGLNGDGRPYAIMPHGVASGTTDAFSA